MKGKRRRLLRLILIVIFFVSTGLWLSQRVDDAEGEAAYENALQSAMHGESGEVPVETVTEPTFLETAWVPAPVEEDDPNLEIMEAIDLEALRETNPEVVGWILIPDTKINYPLMQGQDNDYYLHHTWDGKSNASGSILLEYQNAPDLTDYNTILYGHNMNNGSMFAGLRRYADQGYWEKHPHIYIKIDSGVYRYDIFSSYKASVDSNIYGLSFELEKTKGLFLETAINSSQIETGILPDLTDRMLTLSTCSGAGYTTRWVVHARLKMIEIVVQ